MLNESEKRFATRIPEMMPTEYEDESLFDRIMDMRKQKSPSYTDIMAKAKERADLMMTGFDLRQKAINDGMFAYVTWRWINPLAEWIGDKKCLEIMAGRGWISLALKARGVDVIATDDFSWPEFDQRLPKGVTGTGIGTWLDVVTNVEKIDAVAAIEKYGANVDFVIMSWPPLGDTIAAGCMQTLGRVNPKARVIYIGERCGGCTADDTFFDYFKELDDKKFWNCAKMYQSWYAIHDHLMLGKFRRAKRKEQS